MRQRTFHLRTKGLRAWRLQAMRQRTFHLGTKGRRGCRLIWLLPVLGCLYGCEVEQPAELAGGGSIRFSDLTGQWVIINYWAEWCAPCRDEIPELNELYAQRLDRGEVVESGNSAVAVREGEVVESGNSAVAVREGEPPTIVLGVNYDAVQGDKLIDLIERMDIHFPVLTEDPRGRWGYEQPAVLPTTVVIGPDGTLREQLHGPQTLETLLSATRKAGPTS